MYITDVSDCAAQPLQLKLWACASHSSIVGNELDLKLDWAMQILSALSIRIDSQTVETATGHIFW